jgi:hypothetical protein
VTDGWEPHKDGFTLGNVGVFPGFLTSWEVWENFSGEWRVVDPLLAVSQSGPMRLPGAVPPYPSRERTREETIDAVKALALQWLSERQQA